MNATSFVRHAIAMRRDTRDKLSTFARTSGLSQADVIAALIDFASDPERKAAFQHAIDKRREAKRLLVESRQELLEALEGMSPEELKKVISSKA